MFRVISWGFGILAINSVNFLFVMPTLGLKIVMTYSTGINAILWAINRFFSEISAATGLIFALTFAVFCPALGLAGALLAAPGIINTVAGLLNGALALWNNTWFLLLSGLTFRWKPGTSGAPPRYPPRHLVPWTGIPQHSRYPWHH